MESDFATVLTSLSHPLTKTIIKTADGLATRTDQTVRHFSAEECEVNDIGSLVQLLEAVSADSHKCIVRGKIAPGANRSRMLRRKLAREDAAPTLVEVPHRWLLLDVDGLELASGFDPFGSVTETVRVVASKLPPQFHDVTCWYQFTASAGVKPGLHIRLGFWLDRHLGETDLKLWLGQRVREPGQGNRNQFKEFPIDPSFFGTVQPNYIARPVTAKGAHDPLHGRCARSGVVRGSADEVTVPTIEPAAMPTRSTSQGAEVVISSTLAECLAAIGDHDGGDGCHNALRHATAVWWRRNGSGGNPETLKSLLRSRVASAQWDTAKHPAQYLRQELDRLDSLSESIQGQQRASELSAEEEMTAALCPWPIAGVSLAEAEPILRQHVDCFFEAVAEAQELRAEYVIARDTFELGVEQRQASAAEIEFGSIEGTDALFDTDELDAPEPPHYAQHGIKITAGGGKTYATISKMVHNVSMLDQTFAYSVPTHEKAEEIAALANQLAEKTIAAVWRGIDREDPSEPGAKMCRRADTAKEILRASGTITDLCGSKQRGLCPFHPDAGGGCAYRRQAEAKPKIWIITHASLATKPHFSMDGVDALIVDEALGFGNPREDQLPVADFSADRAGRSQLDTVLPRARSALKQMAPGDFLSREAFEAEGITAETCATAIRCERFGFERIAPAFSPSNDDSDIVAKLADVGTTNRAVQTRAAFWRSLGALLAGGAASSARLRLLPGDIAEIGISTPSRPHARWLDRPVLHLDATLEPRLVRLWLPRFELRADIRIEKGAGVTVHQVTDQAVSYGRIVPGVGAAGNPAKRKTQEATLQKIMRKIEVSTAEDRRMSGTTACIAPKAFVEVANENWKVWGTFPSNLEMAHYGALRGLNALENARRIIVISRPEPGAGEVERIAGVEFDHHAAPALGTGYYPTRPTALRTDGNSRALLNETYHPDPLVMACLQQIRDAEVAQAVHRARPVRRGGGNHLVIEIISGVPIDIAVDSTGTFEDWIETTPAHLLLARGLWPDSWEDKQVVLRDLYPTAQAVRRGFQDNPTATEMRQLLQGAAKGKGAQTPYKKFSIRGLGTFQDAIVWPRYRYKRPGARISHIVAIDPVLHPDPRAVWTERLGVGPLDLFEAVGNPISPPQGTEAVPVLRLSAAPSVAADLFGTDRRGADAPPLPAAPMHAMTAAGHVRFWPDAGGRQPVLVRPARQPPAQATPLAKVPAAEPLLTVDDIRNHVGVSAFAFKTAMSRRRYRKLAGAERERAAIQWLTIKVGREQFIAAVRELGQQMRARG